MPMAVDLNRASFNLTGPEFEPIGGGWAFATTAEKRAYWREVGRLAVEAKRDELRRGINTLGRKFRAVKPSSRPDGATGPPLSPHQESSRFQKWARAATTDRSATVFWSHGWARIVGYHARGAGNLPMRDAVGLIQTSLKWVATMARRFWASGMRRAAESRIPVVADDTPIPIREPLVARAPRPTRQPREARRPVAVPIANPAFAPTSLGDEVDVSRLVGFTGFRQFR